MPLLLEMQHPEILTHNQIFLVIVAVMKMKEGRLNEYKKTILINCSHFRPSSTHVWNKTLFSDSFNFCRKDKLDAKKPASSDIFGSAKPVDTQVSLAIHKTNFSVLNNTAVQLLLYMLKKYALRFRLEKKKSRNEWRRPVLTM